MTRDQDASQAQAQGEVALLAHVRKMQEACANYIEPTTYIARHPDTGKIGDCAWVREFPMPDQNASDHGKAEANARRDAAFIRDMIYMLDGPEQRAAMLPAPGATAQDGATVTETVKVATPTIPAGMVAVPVEPTEAMCEAFTASRSIRDGDFHSRYAAMLAAAPKQASKQAEQQGVEERARRKRAIERAKADGATVDDVLTMQMAFQYLDVVDRDAAALNAPTGAIVKGEAM